ncbi:MULTISPECIES: hypothetical protein [unclassified Agarivorans]|uniref:hypothetical protein n=1 Tax=unclassified Agarivorans TaxID=2636026 RepID=UPI003D7C3B5A
MMISKILVSALILGALSGCVQMPTSTSSTLDNRPQLIFSSAGSTKDLATYTLQVDGLEMGSIVDYHDGNKALKLLSGTHVVEVFDGDKSVLKQKIYLGDGVTKTVIIK